MNAGSKEIAPSFRSILSGVLAIGLKSYKTTSFSLSGFSASTFFGSSIFFGSSAFFSLIAKISFLDSSLEVSSFGK